VVQAREAMENRAHGPREPLWAGDACSALCAVEYVEVAGV